MPIPGTDIPWPFFEQGGSAPADDGSQPIGGGPAPAASAPAGAGQDSQQQATLAYLIGKYGNPVGQAAPVMVKDPITGQSSPDPNGMMTYTFLDNTTAVVGPKGELGAITPGKKPTDVTAPVTTNTTDQNIVMRDPNTGAITTVPNPNYKPPTGTTVAGGTTEPNILTRNADGTVTSTPNPNYKPPVGTTVAGGTTEPNILTRDPVTGAVTSTPNPNYRPPVGTTVATNTTDPFIATRDPVTGAITTTPNPNYQSPIAKPVATNTTDPVITLQDPKTGAITSTPNPNYQAPAPNVVGAPGTTDQFITTRDPKTGALTFQQNPNYVPPKPTQITPSTTAPYITTMGPDGNLTSVPNPSYVATDPGRMTAQLKQQADQQWQALQQQVAQGKLTGDQASSQFDKYWSENIEPVKSDIAAAQAKAQSALASQAAQQNLWNTQAAVEVPKLAETASSNAQRNLISMLPYVVGKGAANSAIGPGGKLDIGQVMQNATYSLPNLQEVGRLGAAAALANISPTAQAHLAAGPQPAQPPTQGLPDLSTLLNQNGYGAGAGMYPPGFNPHSQGVPPGFDNMTFYPGYDQNLGSLLNRGAYGAAPPAVAAPVAAAPAPAAAPAAATTPIDWNALLARQAQDAANQRVQAGITGFGPPAIPGGYADYQPGTYGAMTPAIPWGTYQPSV